LEFPAISHQTTAVIFHIQTLSTEYNAPAQAAYLTPLCHQRDPHSVYT